MTALRGEIAVEHAGVAWRLVLDFNAFAWAEELLAPARPVEGVAPVTYDVLCREVADGKLPATHARALVLATALRHQPEASLLDAGDLLSADAGLVRRLFAAASPTPEEQAELGN